MAQYGAAVRLQYDLFMLKVSECNAFFSYNFISDIILLFFV